MSERIEKTFQKLAAEKKKAFVAYVGAGDPTPGKCLEIIREIADAGVDVIELGVPFSDPMADGIVNQLSADRALKAGMNLGKVLRLIEYFRETHETPIVLFTYLNPVYSYGYEKFHRDAAAVGADGILLLDLPQRETAHHAEFAHGEGLDHIQLIAPTTPDHRQKELAEISQGFIYVLSRTGVTGAQGGGPSETIGALVDSIRKHTDTPVCVGFGISTPEQAREVAEKADGVIVGSAIVKTVQKHAEDSDVAQKVADFVSPLIEATHEA